MTTESALKPVVVGLGEILWDLLPSGRKLGGAPANFAFHASQLGAQGLVVSSVGTDALGRDIFGRLPALGLTTRFVTMLDAYPTGTVSVQLDAHGTASYVIHEGVAWDHIRFVRETEILASRADAVCVGSLAQRNADSRATIQRFLTATRTECLRIFDLNLRQHYFDREIIETTLHRCQVLKLNDEEWPVLASLLGIEPTFPAGLRALLNEYGLSLIALTCGPRGSLLCSPAETDRLEAAPVHVADTVGAGDAFTGALAVGLLKGRPLPVIHRHAARVAAYLCTQPGATPPLPADLVEPQP